MHESVLLLLIFCTFQYKWTGFANEDRACHYIQFEVVLSRRCPLVNWLCLMVRFRCGFVMRGD